MRFLVVGTIGKEEKIRPHDAAMTWKRFVHYAILLHKYHHPQYCCFIALSLHKLLKKIKLQKISLQKSPVCRFHGNALPCLRSRHGSAALNTNTIHHHRMVFCHRIAQVYDGTESSIRNDFSHKTDLHPALEIRSFLSKLKSTSLFVDKLCLHEWLPVTLNKSQIA